MIIDPIANEFIEKKMSHGDQKKVQIIEATLLLLAEFGIEKITYESIALKIGSTKANIKYHFKSKDLLIQGAIRSIMLTAQKITQTEVESTANPQEQLIAIINGAFKWLNLHPEHGVVWSLYLHLCILKKNYQSIYIEAQQTGVRRLMWILGTMDKEHKLNHETSYTLARKIQSIIMANLIDMSCLGENNHHQEYKFQTLETVKILLNNYSIKNSL